MPKSFIKLKKYKIGYYLWSVTGKEIYIHNIDIYPKYQGNGYFKDLMEDIKKCCIENKCLSIRLCPQPQNEEGYFNTIEKLKNLYSKYGFKECRSKKYMEFFIS